MVDQNAGKRSYVLPSDIVCRFRLFHSLSSPRRSPLSRPARRSDRRVGRGGGDARLPSRNGQIGLKLGINDQGEAGRSLGSADSIGALPRQLSKKNP